MVVDPLDREPMVLFPVRAQAVSAVTIAADGRRFLLDLKQPGGPEVAFALLDSSGYRVLGPGWSGQWLDSNRAYFANGQGYTIATLDPPALKHIHLAGNGHDACWLDDSTVIFRTGHGFFDALGSSVTYPVEGELWQVNITTGRMEPYTWEPIHPGPACQKGDAPALSPDGRLVAWIEDIPSGEGDSIRGYRKGVFVADAERTWQRLLASPWSNF